MSLFTIGCDPDLHCTSFAICKDGEPIEAEVVKVPRRKGVIQHEAAEEMMWALFRFSTGWQSCDAFAVEAQTLQRTGIAQHKRPQDIVILGNVAGAAFASLLHEWASRHATGHSCRTIGHRLVTLFPTPERWKGQIPKAVMQARFYSDVGWGYEMHGKGNDYATPLNPPRSFSNIKGADWKHVGDAILLARWAYQQLTKSKAR